MSGLVSAALRMAVRFMLKGQTSAGDRVFDSPIDPLGLILDQGDPTPKPLLAVYVQEVSGKPRGREIVSVEPELDLVIWTYLPATDVQLEDNVAFEVRQSGAALALNIVEAQVNRSMRFAPIKWRSIYEEIVHNVEKVVSRSVLVEIEGGVRVPASETVITCKVIPEPAFGRALSGFWIKFDAAMRAEPTVAGLADMVKNLIEGPADLPSWQVTLGEMALSISEGRAIGVTPLDATETDEPAVLTTIETSKPPEEPGDGVTDIPA